MIEIRVNNIALDISPNTSVQSEINSPLFADDVIFGSYSYPFTLPDTPHNSKTLGYPERLDLKSNPTVKKNVVIWIEGVPWRRGELVIRAYENRQYKVNFQLELSTLKRKFETKLAELPYDDISLAFFDSAEPPTGGLTEYDISYRKFVEIKADVVNSNPIEVVINGQTFVNENDNARLIAEISAAFPNIELIVWFPTVGSAVNYLFRQVQFNGVEEKFDISMSQTGVTWYINKIWHTSWRSFVNNDYAALDTHPDDSDYVFPNMKINGFFELDAETDPRMSPYFNNYDTNQYVREYTYTDDGVDITEYFSMIPCFKLSYLLDRITAHTGVYFSGDFLSSELYSKLIFFNRHSLSHIERIQGTSTHLFADKIHPANHMPDWTISELLLNLRKLGIGIDYDIYSNTLELFLVDPVLRNHLSIQEKKADPDYNINYNPQEGYQIAYEWDDDDDLKNDINGSDFAPLTVGGGENKYTLNFSTLFTKQLTRPFSDIEYKIPVATQGGQLSGEASENAPRFLLFWGSRQDQSGNNYKYASADNHDYASNRLGESTLLLQGSDSLPANLLQKYLEFITNETPSTRRLYWSILELVNFSYKNRYRIDQVRYIVRQLTFNAGSRLNPVKVELMKID